MAYARDPRAVEERFWSKVDRRALDECWPWLEGTDAQGYGQFWVRAGELDVPLDAVKAGGGRGKLRRANRVAFRLIHGYWPRYSLHGCDNPPCCNAENPEHVHEGSSSDNVQEMFRRNRQPDRMRSGESHYRAVLTNDQVAEVRHRYAAGGISQRALAAEYGVGQPAISRYVRGLRY